MTKVPNHGEYLGSAILFSEINAPTRLNLPWSQSIRLEESLNSVSEQSLYTSLLFDF